MVRMLNDIDLLCSVCRNFIETDFFPQSIVDQYLYTPTHSDPDGKPTTLTMSCAPTPCPFYMNGLGKVTN